MSVKTSHTLPSGVRVLIDRDPSASTVAIHLAFCVGGVHDRIAGTAHYLEHLLFKGTRNRSEQDILTECEVKGINTNAYTGYTETAFTATCLKEMWQDAFAILADQVTHSLLEPESVESERTVILQELSQYQSDAAWVMGAALQSATTNTAEWDREIIGTEQSIRTISRQDLVDFVAEHYVTQNCVVAITGNLDPDEVLPVVTEMLIDMPQRAATPPARQISFIPGYCCIPEKREEITIIMMYPLGNVMDHAYPIRRMIRELLGAGENSFLNLTARVERGLTYGCYNFTMWYGNDGALVIRTAVTPENYEAIFPALFTAIARVITDTTIDRMKARITSAKAATAISCEKLYSRNMQMLDQYLTYGYLRPQSEDWEALEAVTVKEVVEEAKSLFRHLPSIGVTGPNVRLDLETIDTLYTDIVKSVIA